MLQPQQKIFCSTEIIALVLSNFLTVVIRVALVEAALQLLKADEHSEPTSREATLASHTPEEHGYPQKLTKVCRRELKWAGEGRTGQWMEQEGDRAGKEDGSDLGGGGISIDDISMLDLIPCRSWSLETHAGPDPPSWNNTVLCQQFGLEKVQVAHSNYWALAWNRETSGPLLQRGPKHLKIPH